MATKTTMKDGLWKLKKYSDILGYELDEQDQRLIVLWPKAQPNRRIYCKMDEYKWDGRRNGEYNYTAWSLEYLAVRYVLDGYINRANNVFGFRRFRQVHADGTFNGVVHMMNEDTNASACGVKRDHFYYPWDESDRKFRLKGALSSLRKTKYHCYKCEHQLQKWLDEVNK